VPDATDALAIINEAVEKTGENAFPPEEGFTVMPPRELL
jgi:hypothetical protein